MQFLSLIAVSLLAVTAAASSERQRYRRWPQTGGTNTGGTTGGTTTGANGMVRVIVVKVGNEAGGLVFEPNDIRANAGDMVQFQFYPKVSTSPPSRAAPTTIWRAIALTNRSK